MKTKEQKINKKNIYPVRCARQAATVPKLKIKTESWNIAAWKLYKK